MVLFAFQCMNHLVNEVVDIEQFQLHTWVVDGDWQVVGDVVAECGYGAVVVGAAPFTIKVWETVNQHLSTSFLAIRQKQVFASLLAAAVLAIAETTSQRCLLRT